MRLKVEKKMMMKRKITKEKGPIQEKLKSVMIEEERAKKVIKEVKMVGEMKLK
jgi:hypothetical protein